MLQTIRDRLTGWIATIIIVVIGLALVISFGNMNTSSVGNTFAARVNGYEIPAFEFRDVLQNQEQQWQAAYGVEIPDSLRIEIAKEVLESLVRQRLLKQYSEYNGYGVSDRVVADYIRAVPAFQLGGEFSTASYESLLSSQGLTRT
ncbi:uncharacterized protein METZ01_LOCUS489293, partial [marine metagenome]